MSLATASLKWSATRDQIVRISGGFFKPRSGGRERGQLTAIAARLDAVVDVGLVFPLHTPQYQARQIAIEIFFQLSYLRGMSRLGAADHDCLLGGRLASDCATGRSGAEALDGCGGVARVGQLGLQGFVFVLGFGEGIGELVGESLGFGEVGVSGDEFVLERR